MGGGIHRLPGREMRSGIGGGQGKEEPLFNQCSP